MKTIKTNRDVTGPIDAVNHLLDTDRSLRTMGQGLRAGRNYSFFLSITMQEKSTAWQTTPGKAKYDRKVEFSEAHKYKYERC